MKIVSWICETGFAGADHTGEIEVEDDATEEEIDEIVMTEVFNYVSWGWTIKNDE